MKSTVKIYLNRFVSEAIFANDVCGESSVIKLLLYSINLLITGSQHQFNVIS